MTTTINGDGQSPVLGQDLGAGSWAGDLLDVPFKARQWPDVHANRGCATVVRSDDPSVPQGAPLPQVFRLEATPIDVGGNVRPRADLGQRRVEQAGTTRYYVGWTCLTSAFVELAAQPGANVVIYDWHSQGGVGTMPLRVTDGKTLEVQILAGDRIPYVKGEVPTGWWPFGVWAFRVRQVIPLLEIADVADQWFPWCARVTWSPQDAVGRFDFFLDPMLSHAVASYSGATMSSFNDTPDPRYCKLDSYELEGAIVDHTGFRAVTRMAEARKLMAGDYS